MQTVKLHASTMAEQLAPKHISAIVLALVRLQCPLDEQLNKLFLEVNSLP